MVSDTYLYPPGGEPYNLAVPYPFDREENQAAETKDILDLVYKNGVPRNGFFLEAGSYDAESFSVSLDLEIKYNWTGLLVEANPRDFKIGLRTHRKAYFVNTCVGPATRPHYENFDFSSAVRDKEIFSMGGLAAGGEKENAWRNIKMQCLPLYTLILAAGSPKINLLILDIEGAEYQGWKFMSCSQCQDLGQQASWLLIGYTRVNNQSEAR